MVRAIRGRRAAVWAALGAVLYVALVCAAPVLHHDFACHLKSPTHCTACVASPLASRLGHSPGTDDGARAAVAALPDRAPSLPQGAPSPLTSGRAPPA